MNKLLWRISVVAVVTFSIVDRTNGGDFIEPTSWRAGTSKANITPERFMWMSGYGSRNRPADGKLTDLWAKTLVIEDADKKQAVLITLDLIGIGRKMSVEICQKIQNKYSIPRHRIAICTSHTHTGPALADNLMPLHYLVVDSDQQKLIADYSEKIKVKIVDAVGQAIKDLEPSTLSWGSGKTTFAVNRRNNSEAKVPQLRAEGKLQGPVDHDVPVLAVHDKEQQLKAVVFGYACHATVLSFYKWSGDYPGFAQIELEEMHPGCQAMFWAGCGGDQNPLPRRQVDLARRYGRELAQAVDAVLSKKLTPLESSLNTDYREVGLPLSSLPTRKQIEGDAESSNRFVKARARFLLEQLDQNGKLSSTYPYPVQTWQIGGQIQWVFLGGEVVVDYAVRIKLENQESRTWVAGYSNDVMAYIASRRILKEGGYEGASAMIYYGLPTSWAPASENMIVDEVNRQLGNRSKEGASPR